LFFRKYVAICELIFVFFLIREFPFYFFTQQKDLLEIQKAFIF